MRNYVLSEKYRQDSATGSKGRQKKYYRNGYWYKIDNRCLESANEHLTSLILSCTDISDYVYYEVCNINGIRGCRSKSFIDETTEIFYSAESIIQSMLSVNKAQDYLWHISSDIKQRFEFLVNILNAFTNYTIDTRRYISILMYLDLFIMNRDRHLGNLGLIYNFQTQRYRTAPIFDNGLSCLCNDFATLIDYDNDIERLKQQQASKTLSGSFLSQIQAVSSNNIFKSPFEIDFNKLNTIIKKDEYVTSLQKCFLISQYNDLKGIYSF